MQAEVDRFPTREVTGDHIGLATLEAYTVMHDHRGPTEALVSALTPAGVRTFARSAEADLMAELMSIDAVGRAVDIDAAAAVHLA